MSGLTIQSALLLISTLAVYGKQYQEDIYLKDHGHVASYHLQYSDEDRSNADEAKNVYWNPNTGRSQYGMTAPLWVPRRVRFGSEAEYARKWSEEDRVQKLFPIYQDGLDQGTGSKKHAWPLDGTRQFPSVSDNNDFGVGFESKNGRWPSDGTLRKLFPSYPNDDGMNQGIGRAPRQNWPRISVPDWFPTPGGISDVDQGDSNGRFSTERLPDWYEFPDTDDYDHGTDRKPEERQLGDNNICQNIKGLPDPESGCCGVQLKRFPNRRGDQQWPFGGRFRRSPDRDLKPDQMIIGGKPTKIHQLPWMARILIESVVPEFGTPKGCGGSIISSRYILTAAHCVYQTFKKLKQVKVFLSEYDTSSYPKDCAGDQCIVNLEMEVDHIVTHPHFNHTHLQNDVALLRLKKDIPYTDFIRPICLPTTDIKNLSEEPILIAGWGKNGKFESNLKRSALIKYVDDQECKRQYSYKDDGMFCSIGGKGEDICHGDSGGPLMVIHEKRVYLSGVVNGKRERVDCGSPVPSLFNNVYYHLEWIKKHVKE